MFSRETLIILYFVLTYHIALVLQSSLPLIYKSVDESTRFRSSSSLPNSKLLMPILELIITDTCGVVLQHPEIILITQNEVLSK